MTEPSVTGDLTLGHILAIAGLDVDDVLVIRHTLTSNGLQPDSSPDEVAAYTREQPFGNKIGLNPPRYWICFMAEGGRRCRLHTIYENYGEVVAERTADKRFFDLIPSAMLKSLVVRLVIEWGRDTINWAKMGAAAAAFPVLKIADPAAVPFPGFDDLELDQVGLLALSTIPTARWTRSPGTPSSATSCGSRPTSTPTGCSSSTTAASPSMPTTKQSPTPRSKPRLLSTCPPSHGPIHRSRHRHQSRVRHQLRRPATSVTASSYSKSTASPNAKQSTATPVKQPTTR